VGDERRRIPVVCDLNDAPDTAEERIAEYRRLFAAHLVGRSYDAGVVQFRFAADAGVDAWVRDLVAREHQCCAFFVFAVSAVEDEVRWDTSVGDDDAARAMLDEWARLPDTVAGGADVSPAGRGSGIHAE
jgi:hypothetical protein